ncbi:MAG: hypothetical protein K1Y36_03325 [Blastocatellia bacterium]|nr:hypothetical protein [Blastocatellia bacterium]
MLPVQRKILFLLFFLSGFCGLLYQTIWLRLAFASFGIITPVISVVVSVFMLGLSLGSWAGGKWIGSLTRRTKLSAIRFYALTEFVIGLGAVTVPWLFKLGERFLLSSGESDSVTYLLYSAIVLTTIILPWCVCMGTTFPFMMAYVREYPEADPKSFSFLYLANVVGAMCGTLITALVLIEIFGFQHTLWIAGGCNLLIAIVSLVLGTPSPGTVADVEAGVRPVPVSEEEISGAPKASRFAKWLLFTTGFTSMAMEVTWTRTFAPALGTQVYAFATLLFVYLLATWIGSWMYRTDLRAGKVHSTPALLAYITVSAFIPAVINDPQLVPHVATWWGTIRAIPALCSIFPFCALLGYLTPRLIDETSNGNPEAAGTGYAVNILGCILGPLVAGYILLPNISAQVTLVLLALPFGIFFWQRRADISVRLRLGAGLVTAAFAILALFFIRGYEDEFPQSVPHMIRRDYAATVISTGEGLDRRLYINGTSITYLTPVTKYMAHLPMAFHQGKPEKALVICFGMGTTFRSLLSWGVDTTAVELSPAVRDSFGYFFKDAETVLRNPKGRIVIDDGRRFLSRTTEKFDVITIDPPPPSEAAGSSLLYSEEFYQTLKRRLKPGGIVQQWYASGEPRTILAVACSILNSFPYVRGYLSVEQSGCHFIASMEPIPQPTSAQLWERMPPAARADLAEWYPANVTDGQIRKTFDFMLSKEIQMNREAGLDPKIRITDDRPFNEYCLLRKLGWK